MTVITVVYNDAEGLQHTIESIKRQNCQRDDFEFIIVDGGSSDGTLDVITSHLDTIDNYISEPDSGIYDAMNKGIQMASNGWYIFMNARDTFNRDDSISSIMATLNEIAGEYNIIYCDTVMGNSIESKEFKLSTFIRGMICHQSIVYSREILKDYSLDYRFISDYDHLISNFSEIRAYHIKKALVRYDLTGISGNRNNSFRIWQERLSSVWRSKLNIFEKIMLSSWGAIALAYHGCRSAIRKFIA